MIILEPVKTEKVIGRIETQNSLTFKVHSSATKSSVKSEVEKLFKVKVAGVRTYVSPKGVKYAIVKLAKEFKADDVAVALKMVA